MKNTKLIRLLKTFSPSEFHDFGKFVNSPFHNESLKLIALHDVLKKYYPGFDDYRLTKENVFIKLYENEVYEDKKLRDRFSDLHKLADEFLAIESLKKAPFEFKIHTLREFSQRGLEVHFDKKYKEIEKFLYNTDVKNEQYFYKDYLLSRELLAFTETRKLLGKRKPYFEGIVNNIEQYLRYFVVQMLRYYSIMNNIKGLVNFKYDLKLYEPVMKYIDDNNLDNYPLIRAFRLMLKLTDNRNDNESYFELKALYLKYHKEMDKYDKIMICTELYNHAYVRYLKENPGFDKERFEIVKLQLEHETYTMENEWMKREYFMICVNMSMNMGKLEWTERFINDYSLKVVPELRDNTYLWAKGFLYYGQKKYDLALKEFSKLKAGDYFYYTNTRLVISRIYYELMEYENELTLIDSFRHYISSNSFIPEPIKLRYTNYINVLYKLTNLTMNKDEYKIDKLIEEIKNYSMDDLTIHKSWLLEKAMELRKK